MERSWEEHTHTGRHAHTHIHTNHTRTYTETHRHTTHTYINACACTGTCIYTLTHSQMRTYKANEIGISLVDSIKVNFLIVIVYYSYSRC